MPCLDAELWIGKEQRTQGVPTGILEESKTKPTCKTGALKNVILYSFYRKPMAKKIPLSRRTAAPEKTLVTTASNEFMRRFKNVSRDLPTTEIDDIVSCYAGDLMRGGFERRWVVNVLKAAATGYSRKVAENNGGGAPINRPGDWNRDGREAEKLKTKT